MEANKHSIKHLVSQGTDYDALCAAIRIAYSHGVKDAMLTSNFEVNRPTLSNLKKGKIINRNRDLYFEAITTTLNNLRLEAKSKGEKDRENDLRNALADIALLRCGIAPDWEIEGRDRGNAKYEFLNSISCKRG
jgi:hypothetical protein